MKQFLIFELNSAIKKMDRKELLLGIRSALTTHNKVKISKILKKQGKKRTPPNFREYMSGVEVYLPFRELRGGRYHAHQKDYYISGYGFMEVLPFLDYSCLEYTLFIDYILRSPQDNQYELLSETTIRKEQSKMAEFFSGTFRQGQLIQVIDGMHSNMPARIVSYESKTDTYTLVIASRSNTWDVSIPSSYLSVREDDRIVAIGFIEEETQ